MCEIGNRIESSRFRRDFRLARQFPYDVLGRILKSKGDLAGERSSERVVQAARIEEVGQRAEDARNFPLAVQEYDRALKLNPRDCLAQNGLTESLLHLGRRSEARSSFRTSIELLPLSHGSAGGVDPISYHTFQNEGERDETRTELVRLKRTHPRDPGVLLAIGQFDLKIGDAKGALASFEEAVSIDPNYLRAWQEICELAVKGVETKSQMQQAGLAIIKLDPGGSFNYYASHVLETLGDKAALWRGYYRASGSNPPVPRAPLFPLEASKQSMSAGTRPIEDQWGSYSIQRRRSGIEDLPELQALYP